jgi:hypothetical protein
MLTMCLPEICSKIHTKYVNYYFDFLVAIFVVQELGGSNGKVRDKAMEWDGG